MRNLILFLLTVFIAPSSRAMDSENCSPKGVDICSQSKDYVAWLNGGHGNSHQYFNMTRAISDGSSITAFFTYVPGKEGMDSFLAEMHLTRNDLDQVLKEVSQEAICKNDRAHSIVVNGGTVTSVYEYPDGSPIFSYTVTSC